MGGFIKNITIGFYSKHFYFWLAIAALVYSGSFIRSQFRASADIINAPQQTAINTSESVITINSNSSVTIDGKKSKARFTPLNDFDRMQLILIEKPTSSIPYANYTVKLPANIDVDSINIIPTLVHSYTFEVDKHVINRNTFSISAQNISPQGTMSLQIDFPKGQLSYPASLAVISFLINTSLSWWIGLSLAIPLICFIILSIIIFKRTSFSRQFKDVQPLNKPPSDLPVAICEVLMDGRITKKSLAATIVDLANRGYVEIGYHGSNFKLGKHRQFKLPSEVDIAKIQAPSEIEAILQAVSQIKDKTDLKYYERLLLSKLFSQAAPIVNREDVEVRIEHRLFSEKIAMFYQEIYQIANRNGYFLENPAGYHKKFKIAGIILFYTGFIGFGLGIKFFPDPKTALLIWVGMIFSALVLISNSSKLPILNEKGIQELRNWMAFKKYLTSSDPVPYSRMSSNIFQKYLPYAIVFDVEREWSARFRDHPFMPPVWFISDDTYTTIEQFDSELFPMIEWIGQSLSLARTPTVD